MTAPAPGPTPADTPSDAGGPPSEVDKLRHRVAGLSRKRQEAEDRLQALLLSLLSLDDALADTRRRAGVLHEARSARETASAAVVLGEQIEDAHRMLRAELDRYDVSPMEVIGRAVDLTEMRVVGAEPHPTRPRGTVLREEISGFRRGSAVLRPAQVVVAVPGPAPEPVPVLDPVPDPVRGPDPVSDEVTDPVRDSGPAPDPVPASGTATESGPASAPPAGGGRTQPRRTTRAQRLLRKPSAGRGRRSRRSRRA